MAKRDGFTRSPLSGAISGYDLSDELVIIEETSNHALVRGLKRWWLSKQIQAKTAKIRARKDRVPVFVATWDGKPRLVVMEYERFVELLDMARSNARQD